MGQMLWRTNSIIASRGGSDESNWLADEDARVARDRSRRGALRVHLCGSPQARFDEQLWGQLRRRRIAAKVAASEEGPYNEGLDRMNDQIPDTVPERREVLPASSGFAPPGRCR
jgi:hypothetical protein